MPFRPPLARGCACTGSPGCGCGRAPHARSPAVVRPIGIPYRIATQPSGRSAAATLNPMGSVAAACTVVALDEERLALRDDADHDQDVVPVGQAEQARIGLGAARAHRTCHRSQTSRRLAPPRSSARTELSAVARATARCERLGLDGRRHHDHAVVVAHDQVARSDRAPRRSGRSRRPRPRASARGSRWAAQPGGEDVEADAPGSWSRRGPGRRRSRPRHRGPWPPRRTARPSTRCGRRRRSRSPRPRPGRGRR